MAPERSAVPLGHVAKLRKGISYSGRYLDQPGPLLLGLGTIVPGGGIKLSEARPYSGPVKEQQRIRPGEIFVALTDITQDGRVLGSPALIPPDAEGEFVVTHHVARVEVIDKAALDTRFLYYLLMSQGYLDYMRGVATGTTVRAVSVADAEAFQVNLPTLFEQRAIGHILGTLDDKIELNRRMNETLEAMARALFRSWFVDFDPVRAKAASSDSGLPEQWADLFPDSFEDSALGEIPRGWEIRSIGDLATVVGGTTPSTKEPAYWDGGTHHWATPRDLSSLANPVLLDTERRITDAGLAQVSSGLLPAGTVLLSSRAPIGYLAITEVPVAINQGFIAMRPAAGVPNLFLLFWAASAHEEILTRANGSTFLEVSKSAFRPIPVVRPTDIELDAFERAARPLYMRIVANERESRVLVEVRETLMPALLSGWVSAPG